MHEGNNMMNPVVVMAVWGRQKLVEINLRMLSEQKCQVIVVASAPEDFVFLRSLKLQNIQIVPHPNNPLGKKWQEGVDQARILGANPVIICGSDDFLSSNFIEKACELSKYHDFIFFDNWFIHEPKGCKNYTLRYNMAKYNKPPLGSGRIYSHDFLQKRHWQLFDTGKDIHLDNFAWENVRHQDRILMNPKDMHILAVKGDWEQINPIDKILSHSTIDWDHEKSIDQYFNFQKSVKETFQGI
jgi:hypothetical protein